MVSMAKDKLVIVMKAAGHWFCQRLETGILKRGSRP
jgi:hypothetical protein